MLPRRTSAVDTEIKAVVSSPYYRSEFSQLGQSTVAVPRTSSQNHSNEQHPPFQTAVVVPASWLHSIKFNSNVLCPRSRGRNSNHFGLPRGFRCQEVLCDCCARTAALEDRAKRVQDVSGSGSSSCLKRTDGSRYIVLEDGWSKGRASAERMGTSTFIEHCVLLHVTESLYCCEIPAS